MCTVSEHYTNLLAPIYLWMAGGIDATLMLGANDISGFVASQPENPLAIDLGAGFGMHAIPLARSGYAVTAIDNSPILLAELKKYALGLNIQTIEDDLLNFQEHLSRKADLIICMGDTITHLQDPAHVENLFKQISGALTPSGRAVITFRDYTSPLKGDARFIPVRSDADRIHTCFLEEAPEYMVVHDLVHERHGSAWSTRVSSYKKLRLSPEWVLSALKRVGLKTTIDSCPRGMLRFIAVSA